MRYGNKWPEYAKQWDAMQINSNRRHEFESIAKGLISLKSHYTPIEAKTGVPWFVIALIHLREASNDFSKSLAQGDPWNRRSHNKPISGPFNSFEESAIWALRHDLLSSQKDWRLEKILYFQELYNGAGYDMRGLPSPYIWGGTNQQKPGKFTSDRVFSRTKWDGQPGVAPIMKIMSEMDDSIKFTRED